MVANNLSIRNKAIFLLIFFSFIPITLFGIITYIVTSIVTSQTIINDQNELTLKAMAETANNINSIINNQHVILDNLAHNLEIIQTMNDKKTQDTERKMNRLLMQQITNMIVDVSLFAINEDGMLFGLQPINQNDRDDTKKMMDSNIIFQKIPAGDFSIQDIGMNDSFLSQPFPSRSYYSYKNILLNGEYVGTFVIGSYEYRFSRLLDALKLENTSNCFIVNSTGNIVINEEGSSELKPQIATMALDYFNKPQGYEIKTIDNKNYVVCYYHINSENWQMVKITPYSIFYAKLSQVKYVMIACSILTAFMILFLVILMNKSMLNPIMRLSSLMLEVKKGNLDVRAKVKSNDEIGVLNLGFNKMLDEFQRLMENAIQDERSKKVLQFRALQEQIKPHFLCNTLNTIRWLAEIQNASVIAEAIVSLGRLFEYMNSPNNDCDFVKVYEEIQYLKNYVYLQQLRYLDSFSCNFFVEKEASECQIIKFILQPILENSIIHGFKNMKSGGIIDVSVTIELNRLLIQITDNGIGIGEDIVEQLKYDAFDKRVGIPNVQERLRLNYSEKYFLKISPGIHCGTIVQLWLPAEDASTERVNHD